MTKAKKLITLGAAYGTALLLNPGSVFANSDNISITNVGGNIANSISNIKPSGIVSVVIQALLGVAGIIAFIFLLWGGLQWILSGGDKEGTEKARKRITAALIGLAIVFSAYALLFIVRAVFGVNFFEFTLPQIAKN